MRRHLTIGGIVVAGMLTGSLVAVATPIVGGGPAVTAAGCPTGTTTPPTTPSTSTVPAPTTTTTALPASTTAALPAPTTTALPAPTTTALPAPTTSPTTTSSTTTSAPTDVPVSGASADRFPTLAALAGQLAVTAASLADSAAAVAQSTVDMAQAAVGAAGPDAAHPTTQAPVPDPPATTAPAAPTTTAVPTPTTAPEGAASMAADSAVGATVSVPGVTIRGDSRAGREAEAAAPAASAPTTDARNSRSSQSATTAAPELTSAPDAVRATADACPPDPTGDATSAAAAFGWGTPSHSEDFNGPLGSSWGLYDGPGHAGKGKRTPTAVGFADGIMTITGDAKGNTEGMSWNFGQKYGRWEGRVRAPASDPSYNALMLLWPDAENWPKGGEVDFMEMSDRTRRSTNMFLHYGKSNAQLKGSVTIDATQWHDWAVEWTPTHITAFVDGRQWWRSNNTKAQPPGPMHLCIQLDWFPKGATVAPSQMQVDWVRQYPVT